MRKWIVSLKNDMWALREQIFFVQMLKITFGKTSFGFWKVCAHQAKKQSLSTTTLSQILAIQMQEITLGWGCKIIS